MSREPSTELDAWLARLADGDRSAFTPAFRALWPKVLRLCKSMLKNDADAADAAQQALEKVLTRSHEYDRARSALPWALGIAAWECRTSLRKRARRRETAEATPEAPVESVEESLAQRQLVEAALGALDELSSEDKETLTSTFWEEAASVTGATLRKRRERALKRLRDAFRRLYGFD